MLAHLLGFIPLLARGGGGGSGGGGGGGGGGAGGGSGGGSGGGGGILYFIGYLPPHFVGYWTRKRMSFGIAATISAVFGVAYAIALGVIFFNIESAQIYGVILPLLALAGTGAGIFGWFDGILKRAKKAKKIISAAEHSDPAWDEAALKQRATEVFQKFQADWTNFAAEDMKKYLMEDYRKHVVLMLAAIKELGRVNQVDSPVIKDLIIIDALDQVDNDSDTFTVQLTGQADDKLVDSASNKVLFEDKKPFIEFWQFARQGNQWLLEDIRQSTEDASRTESSIAMFAAANQLYYSLDWGWLLLPLHGQIFGKAKFGTSDINNHCIGYYHNLLIQLYTYVPATANSGQFVVSTNSQPQQYVIAQATLPKSYGSIVIRPKPRFQLFSHVPRGYNKLKLEWPEFNRRYEVMATDVEKVTAFELLHPVYMEQLFALKFKVGIEVVDNTLYLYTLDRKAKYDEMLQILQKGFAEMRL